MGFHVGGESVEGGLLSLLIGGTVTRGAEPGKESGALPIVREKPMDVTTGDATIG